MTHIRLATIDDVAAILEISNHYARTTPANFAVEPEPLDMWLQSFDATHEMYPWLVAMSADEQSGAIIGFAKASPWKGRCAYTFAAETSVYIAPDACGRGVGRALYDRLFATLRAQGYRTLLAGITLPNEASVRLHEDMGMKRVALLERVGWKFDRWHDVGYWQVHLDAADEPAPQRIRPVREVFSAEQSERPGD